MHHGGVGNDGNALGVPLSLRCHFVVTWFNHAGSTAVGPTVDDETRFIRSQETETALVLSARIPWPRVINDREAPWPKRLPRCCNG